MPNPAVLLPSSVQGHGSEFTRRRLRDAIGPGNALYRLLEDRCIRDVFGWQDDFDRTLDTGLWTASNSGGAGVANFARVTNGLSGLIEGNPGTDNDADVRLFTTSREDFQMDNRPVVLARLRLTTVALSKFEFGFAAAVQAGQVSVKATPTATGTDYAVAVRDVDDDTNIGLASAGDTTAEVSVVDSAPGLTLADGDFFVVMIALNERGEAYLWLNGIYQATHRTAANLPTAGTSLGVWVYAQNRSGASRPLRVDYVKAWQERVAV